MQVTNSHKWLQIDLLQKPMFLLVWRARGCRKGFCMPNSTSFAISLVVNKTFLYHLFNENGEGPIELMKGEKFNQTMSKFAPLCPLTFIIWLHFSSITSKTWALLITSSRWKLLVLLITFKTIIFLGNNLHKRFFFSRYRWREMVVESI